MVWLRLIGGGCCGLFTRRTLFSQANHSVHNTRKLALPITNPAHPHTSWGIIGLMRRQKHLNWALRTEPQPWAKTNVAFSGQRKNPRWPATSINAHVLHRGGKPTTLNHWKVLGKYRLGVTKRYCHISKARKNFLSGCENEWHWR